MTVEVAVPNSPYDLCGRKATLNSGAVLTEVEVAVLGSSSLTVLLINVEVKQH